LTAAPRQRFAIARARFNGDITQALLDGALRAFEAAGVARKRVDVFEVPGSFELPLAALWLGRSRTYDAIVCLGCVIRGETPHFDFVAAQAARGIASAAWSTGIPVIFGVITANTVEQAWARAGGSAARASDHVGRPVSGNKGYEAAQAAIDMAALRARLRFKR